MTGVSGTVGEDYIFPFTTEEDANYKVDVIGSLSRPEHIVFNSDGGYSRTIAYEGFNYRTIASTPILGGFEDTENNTKADLMKFYVGYLLEIDGVFRGYVTDTKTGDPIQNATVNLGDGNNTGNTDEYGLCAIEVPPGTYEVSCTHPDYESLVYPSEIVIRYNDMYWLNLELTPKVSVDDVEHQNRITRIYPNPCTSDSRVEFFVKTSEDVDIALYNILGQRVSTLVHEYVGPGYHEVFFEKAFNKKEKLSSGIYFMKLESDTNTHIHKLLLIE